jgi:hypothetical protein
MGEKIPEDNNVVKENEGVGKVEAGGWGSLY